MIPYVDLCADSMGAVWPSQILGGAETDYEHVHFPNNLPD